MSQEEYHDRQGSCPVAEKDYPPSQGTGSIAFRVTVENAYGRHQVEWNAGTANDFTRAFGVEAGQKLLHQFYEPAQLRAAMQHSTAEPFAFPPPNPHPAPLPPIPGCSNNALMLSAGAIDIASATAYSGFPQSPQAQTQEPTQNSQESAWWTLAYIKNNQLIRRSLIVFFLVSLGVPNQPFPFTLRNLLLGFQAPVINKTVEASDWMNPVAYLAQRENHPFIKWGFQLMPKPDPEQKPSPAPKTGEK